MFRGDFRPFFHSCFFSTFFLIKLKMIIERKRLKFQFLHMSNARTSEIGTTLCHSSPHVRTHLHQSQLTMRRVVAQSCANFGGPRITLYTSLYACLVASNCFSASLLSFIGFLFQFILYPGEWELLVLFFF